MEPSVKQWYVLNAVGSIKRLEREIASFSALREQHGGGPVEYFLPTCIEQSTMFGKSVISRKKLLGNYLFVRESHQGIRAVTAAVEALRMLPHPDEGPDGNRWMTISDRDLSLFRTIAAAHANKLPCYPIDMVDLEDGDQVEIVGGEFDGVSGTLQCRQGCNGGRVLMSVGNLFLVSTPDIQPQYIRILRFGKGNRHPYRKFEAHLSRAMLALRHLLNPASVGLTTQDVASMSVFAGRFEALEPATVNIASQHATLMLMSYVSLQDKEKAERWLRRCRNLLASIKSDTQRAWQLAFMYASTGDVAWYSRANDIASAWTVAANDHKRALIISALTEYAELWKGTRLSRTITY